MQNMSTKPSKSEHLTAANAGQAFLCSFLIHLLKRNTTDPFPRGTWLIQSLTKEIKPPTCGKKLKVKLHIQSPEELCCRVVPIKILFFPFKLPTTSTSLSSTKTPLKIQPDGLSLIFDISCDSYTFINGNKYACFSS